MYLRNNSTVSGVTFIFFFVIQQLITFVFTPYAFFPIFQFLIIGITILIGLSLPILKKTYQLPFFLMIVCVIGSFLTFFSGTPIGGTIVKALYAIIGYIGFVYVSERRINLRVFDIVILILYFFFYFSYFIYDSSYRKEIDNSLFGESSSNTIAMGLNVVLFFYLTLSSFYEEKNKYQILIFAIVNLTLIIIQGSRAGVLVAFILLILAISNQLKKKSKRLLSSFFILTLIGSVLIYIYFEELAGLIDLDRMHGVNALEEDIRGSAQKSFFGNMNLGSFLFGYKPDYEFAFNITRTYNAFLDFWNKYGFLPFFLVISYCIRRVLRMSDFQISIIYFVPIFVYSFVESLWGSNSWDILIYFSLFYSFKNEVNSKKILKTV